MSKHTAGSWDSEGQFILSPEGNYVAEVYVVGNDEDGTRRQANVLLIASAPDMLAALEWCTKMLEKDKIGLSTEERHALQAAYNVLDKLKENER